jgi:hypothetical protein
MASAGRSAYGDERNLELRPGWYWFLPDPERLERDVHQRQRGFNKAQFKHSLKMLCSFSASDGSNVQQCDDSAIDLVQWRFQ